MTNRPNKTVARNLWQESTGDCGASPPPVSPPCAPTPRADCCSARIARLWAGPAARRRFASARRLWCRSGSAVRRSAPWAAAATPPRRASRPQRRRGGPSEARCMACAESPRVPRPHSDWKRSLLCRLLQYCKRGGTRHPEYARQLRTLPRRVCVHAQTTRMCQRRGSALALVTGLPHPPPPPSILQQGGHPSPAVHPSALPLRP